jgi:predicted ribosome quality control (RQC) complex YloA/Tae2 family protein
VAAHELLHAVYANLGPAERARIDAELQAARAGNQRLEERLKPYGSGPTLLNEVHSILGSEFDGLSPALEAHYAQFFANRAAVVAARQRTLGTREEEIQRLRADVDDLDARIESLRATQEQLRTAGDIRTYNANVSVINGLIDRYNAQVDALNARIEEYNGLLGG